MSARVKACGVALVMAGCIMAQASDAPEPTEVQVPAAVVEKQVAAGTANLLSPREPLLVAVPEWLAVRVKSRTAVFYFSPTCPHCQDAMPEINALVQREPIGWLGVAASSSTLGELETFNAEFVPAFDVVQDDADRGFADAVQAMSTPSVYVFEPPAGDGEQGENTLMLHERFSPFVRGAGGVLSIREHPEDPFKHFDGYVGLRTCGSCHSQEARSWTLTHHAVAYRTLYMRERAQDEQCVGCHVTGLGTEGGFAMGDHGSEMRDVTCEACHGPGGPHGTAQAAVDPKATCVGCHDAEHSIAFTVEKGLPHIDHFAGNGLSEEALRGRIGALLQGEASRPLLAFPEGPTLGAKACRSCHKSAHKGWKRSPHGQAMAALKGDEQTQVGCVRCHATAQAYGGTTPAGIEDFRLEESVGCEACHGAGGAHAERPSKDNIVGLGESCPECVIEAICTRCHTPKWDPAWSLDTRLEAAKHP